MEIEQIVFEPQPGAQEAFLSCGADIAVYGGAAGGGKTYSILLEPLRYFRVSDWNGVIFRHNANQILNAGGLWDTASNIYPVSGYTSRSSTPRGFTSPFGARLDFAHIEIDKDLESWQGSQICYIGWDELTHFTKKQFFYMLSRNRSTSGIKPIMRGTCNPDPESWVADLIDWWIGPDGYPIKERSGIVRYFVHINDELIWSSDADDLTERFPGQMPKSFTFIASTIHDNKILLEKDPSYMANLLALSQEDQNKLLHGNWHVKIDDPYAIIQRENVLAARKRILTKHDYNFAPLIFGVDPARSGIDSSFLTKRQGLKVWPPTGWSKLKTGQLGVVIAREIDKDKPDAVFIDAGAGAGLIDWLHDRGYLNVYEVPFNSVANAARFYNKRAEMYTLAAEWTVLGSLPDDPELCKELCIPKYKYRVDDRKQIEEKDEIKKRMGGKSPDRADSFVLTFAQPVHKQASNKTPYFANGDFANGNYDIFKTGG